VRVNKRELARILGVSLPTIGAWLDRYPEFPVLQSGTNGREYQFDAVAVRDFMAIKDAEEERLEKEREAAIAQLGLPLEEQTEDGAGALKPRERLDHVRAISAEDKLRQERGFLVSVPAARQAMTAAVARWNRAIHARIRQDGRDFNLPDAVVRALLAGVAETQHQFVRELGYDAGLTEAGRNAA
jgi:phage terminase Nu1 subunit (DNA packaging protein)